MRKSRQEMEAIKQNILDYCTEYRTTQQIAAHLGVRPQYAFGYCDYLKEYKFLERKEGLNEFNMQCFLFKTKIPVFRVVRQNEATAVEEERWSWLPFGFMDIQVKPHDVKGRVFKIDERSDDSEYVKHIKDADKRRREEARKKTTNGVFVSGSTLHMAV